MVYELKIISNSQQLHTLYDHKGIKICRKKYKKINIDHYVKIKSTTFVVCRILILPRKFFLMT